MKSSQVFAITEGPRAALRLKLTTVELTNIPFYNVRRQTFCSLLNGRDDFIEMPSFIGITMDDEVVDRIIEESSITHDDIDEEVDSDYEAEWINNKKQLRQ